MTVAQHERLGYNEHVGDTEVAGEIARDIYTNWDNDRWRNAFIMSLGSYCENQVMAHKEELEAMIHAAHTSTVDKARRAVVKSYLVSKASVRIDDYTRKGPDGTRIHVEGYTQHRPGAARRVPVGDDPQAAAAALLAAYNQRVAPDKQAAQHHVAYHISGPNGDHIAIHNAGEAPHVAPDEEITHIQSLGIPDAKLSGHQAYNLATQLGANAAQAGSAGAVVQGVADAGKGKDWFERLTSMSKALHYATGGGAGPVPVQVATAMGQAVGQHGPEVARVLGPSIRRYSYKYRGMTAAPEQFSRVALDGRQADGKGNKETNQAFERKLLGTLASTNRAKGGLGAVPTDEQNRLMLQSGATAPSQGFIIDPRGKAVQQAVGHADDHYVPFNLSKLHALKNGSYVRSRAYGGPTTEDISLGMRSGASRISTISRHGIYTVQFDPRANTKRYGYTPRQVVNKYARLLDAIQSGKVTDPQDNSKQLKLDEHGYSVALQSLKHQYPFLIQAVYHEPPSEISELEGLRAGTGEKDTGYIRPMYLKPTGAMAGFHDPLLGGAQSYDHLEGYRSAKASRLAVEREKARQDARPPQRGPGGAEAAKENIHRYGINPEQPGFTPQQKQTAQALGTDWGATRRSYRSREWSETKNAAMQEHAAKMLQWHLNNSSPDELLPEAGRFYSMFDDAKNGDKDAIDGLEMIRTGEGGTREDLIDVLGDISDQMEKQSADPLALGHYIEWRHGLSDDDEADDKEYQAQAGKAPTISPEALANDPMYKAAMRHQLMTAWRNTKDPNMSSEKKDAARKWFEEPQSNGMIPGEFFDDPTKNATGAHPDDIHGFTPYEQMARQMARARGQNLPFKRREVPEEEAEDPHTAVSEEDDDETRARKAKEYEEQAYRELMAAESPDDDSQIS